MEPDEDEDPTRTCVKCGERPRWSRHWTCTRCVVCAGKSVRWCLLQRKEGPDWKSPKPKFVARRERYRALRDAGASVAVASKASQGPRAFARAMEQITQHRADDGAGRPPPKDAEQARRAPGPFVDLP